MKNRKLLSIFMALALAASTSVMFTGCSGGIVSYEPGYGPEASKAAAESSAAESSSTEESSEESSEEESSEEESSEEESSEEESSEEESSEEESSEEESSEEESSEEESSEEESSEEESSEEESSEEESSEEESSEEESSEDESSEVVEGTVISFTKPDNWGDTVYAYVYEEGGSSAAKNADWPGEAMTDNGDGTFTYVVPDDIENPVVIFNDSKKQYPRSKGLAVENGKNYDTNS